VSGEEDIQKITLLESSTGKLKGSQYLFTDGVASCAAWLANCYRLNAFIQQRKDGTNLSALDSNSQQMVSTANTSTLEVVVAKD
jgi:hypothetical protein